MVVAALRTGGRLPVWLHTSGFAYPCPSSGRRTNADKMDFDAILPWTYISNAKSPLVLRQDMEPNRQAITSRLSGLHTAWLIACEAMAGPTCLSEMFCFVPHIDAAF